MMDMLIKLEMHTKIKFIMVKGKCMNHIEVYLKCCPLIENVIPRVVKFDNRIRF